jgi:hypothetical protein
VKLGLCSKFKLNFKTSAEMKHTCPINFRSPSTKISQIPAQALAYQAI